jgi:phosphoserine phosphatase
MYYNPDDTIWVMGKFAYGVTDDDIKDEDVDVWLDRGCDGAWELLDTVRTTDDGEHPTVEGVEDTGGWVFYDATSLDLGVGRHRFLLVVGGDLSTAEVYVDLVEPGTPIILSDVDGTLTTEENEEFTALLTGSTPDANPDSAEVLSTLAAKGYRVMYLTARPQFLAGRTREFLEERGYPLGLVHTTLSFTGATGDSAVTYKTAELAALAGRGLVPAWAFGNTASDAEAYDNAGVLPLDQRIMFRFTDDWGARRIEDYAELLPEIGAAPPVTCP